MLVGGPDFTSLVIAPSSTRPTLRQPLVPSFSLWPTYHICLYLSVTSAPMDVFDHLISLCPSRQEGLEDMSLSEKQGVCLLSPTCVGIGANILATMEASGTEFSDCMLSKDTSSKCTYQAKVPSSPTYPIALQSWKRSLWLEFLEC